MMIPKCLFSPGVKHKFTTPYCFFCLIKKYIIYICNCNFRFSIHNCLCKQYLNTFIQLIGLLNQKLCRLLIVSGCCIFHSNCILPAAYVQCVQYLYLLLSCKGRVKLSALCFIAVLMLACLDKTSRVSKEVNAIQ